MLDVRCKNKGYLVHYFAMIRVIFFLVPVLLFGAVDPLFMTDDSHLRIVVNNRVLANVNGKPITVIDVMKRMDLLFLKQFPEYVSSVTARHQFYQANWKRILSELVDKELILADAKELKMEVASGEVRQEMEELFGPNIILNLDKIGLSLDEAQKIVSGDIAIRRMVFLKVTSKAMGRVTPQVLRDYYPRYAEDNSQPLVLSYRMLTVRDADPQWSEEAAKKIYEELVVKKKPIEVVLKQFEEQKGSISLSNEFTHNEKEIAPQNKEVLSTLQAGDISPPIKQTSKDDSVVWRLFLVSKRTDAIIPTYKESESKMKEELLDVAVSVEQKSYLDRLRRHFAVKESQLKDMVPEEFTPFILK